MTQLKCQLKNGQVISISLLNNPFVYAWIEQFNIVNKFCEFEQHYFSPIVYEKNWNQYNISVIEQKIKDSINKLNLLSVNFPINVEEIKITNNSEGRNLLNRLHRHFTTGHRTVCEEENFTWLENSNLNFQLSRENYQDFAKYVHQINDCVHESEKYFINDRKLNFSMTKEWLVLYRSQTYNGSNENFQYFLNIKEEHKEYFSDDMNYDVWLPLSQIQGKNYLQSYVDEDDPTHWDISSNIFYSGSFSIGDRSWYYSQEIQNYLKSYGIDPNPQTCGMPLGKIIDGKEFLNNIQMNQIISMTLYE